ncbi:ABC-2 type transport system ATP-binding protein [Salsuginibacillus halophilus]|uniref:ABC-2 type transport system ATP-binding protein n=2 Tax=Salsuginibacillus halophilus TaxID=517424 RepID=A0A2P8HBH2_9BACI|nr:ABC-2 type transport system ATP-binding protein [Salsuginibacillus halophilus]
MEVRNISKSIQETEVLCDVSFSIAPGTITGIVGRNGVGKTSLLKTMVDIFRPDEGEVRVKGESIQINPSAKQHVIFVSDVTEAFKNESVDHIVSFYREVYPSFDHAYFEELMARFDLEKIQQVKKYSKGRKALFALILAFATRADFVLLDEPTDGLDVIVKRQMMQFMVEAVAENDISILIATHRLDELETLADQIIMLKDGQVEARYELESVKMQYQKMQIVYAEQMPEEVIEKVNILQQSGRVYVCFIARADNETKQAVEKSGPLLIEELPMSLEDLFIAKLGGDRFAT